MWNVCKTHVLNMTSVLVWDKKNHMGKIINYSRQNMINQRQNERETCFTTFTCEIKQK